MARELRSRNSTLLDAVLARLDRNTAISALTILTIFVTWEVGSQTEIIDPRFFPPPTAVVDEFFVMYAAGEITTHFLASIRRISVAFAIGASAGICAGMLMGWSRTIKSIMDPYISVLYPIPKIVLLPVMFLFFGVGETARILTIALGVFLLVAINTMAGVHELDEVYLEAATDNGASRFQLFREVLLPGALPQIFTGLSLGIGLTFILIVVIEMIGANSGLGWLIWNSWERFTVTRMYVAIVTINVLGIIFVYGFEWLGGVIAPWRE